MGGVNINLTNGGLGGTLQTNDGVAGLVITGVTEGGGYTLGTVVLVTGMTSVTAAGITVANNPYAIRHLQDFYNEAGDGAQLYLMMVSTTMTVAVMALNSNANGVVKLLNFAAGAVKVVGLLSDDKAIVAASGTVTVTNGLNADVYTAAASLKTTINGYVAAKQPLRGLIGGTSYNGVPANLVNETTGTSNNRVGIVIGDTQIYDATNGSAAMGLLLGRIASIPVQRKISRVRDGSLSNIAAYLGSVALLCTNADIATISGKGFITFTAYAQKSGFFWQGDQMLTATTDDYCLLAHGRIIDKVSSIAYQTFLNEVDDEIPINADGSGTMVATFSTWLQQQIIDQINNSMTKGKEISAVACRIDPAQNVISNSQVNVVLSITPVGYATAIVISLGFSK
jgi:hypothetical protein